MDGLIQVPAQNRNVLSERSLRAALGLGNAALSACKTVGLTSSVIMCLPPLTPTAGAKGIYGTELTHNAFVKSHTLIVITK